jgi:hypothetical protein
MAAGYGSFSDGEDALSEVIGFILIIAVLITAFSIWLTYGIPVQGRDNEISHMNDVQDAFTSYKIGVDSLWVNGQTNTVQSNTINMGAAGQTSQGNNGFLPILEPVGSSGMIVINNRTPTPEWLNITSYSYITNQTSKTNDTAIPITSAITSHPYQNPPNDLLINISGLKNVAGLQLQPGVVTLAVNSSRAIFVNGTDNTGTAWQAWVNLTPRYSFYQFYNLTTPGTSPTPCTVAMNTNGTAITVRAGAGTDYSCLFPMNAYSFTGTDLTLSVIENKTRTLNNLILYSNISSSGTPYVIDLLDPTYNLVSNIQGSSTIWYQEYDPLNDMADNATAQYAYWYPPVFNYTIPLGALEYRANNNYFIHQTYYYQAGGVFLSQIDGITDKLPPEITFSYNQSGSIGVNIIGIAYVPSNSGSIGGTAPVKIGTIVEPNLGSLPYAPLTNNTMNVTINYTSPTGDMNSILMWKNYFQQAANTTAGIPNNGTFFTVGNTTTGAYIVVKGINDPGNVGSNYANPDINLMVKAVNLSVSIQSIGGE